MLGGGRTLLSDDPCGTLNTMPRSPSEQIRNSHVLVACLVGVDELLEGDEAAVTSSPTRGDHQAALLAFSGRALNYFAMSASASSSQLDMIAIACHALHRTDEPVPLVVLREVELLFGRGIQRQLLCADGQLDGILPAVTRAS